MRGLIVLFHQLMLYNRQKITPRPNCIVTTGFDQHVLYCRVHGFLTSLLCSCYYNNAVVRFINAVEKFCSEIDSSLLHFTLVFKYYVYK